MACPALRLGCHMINTRLIGLRVERQNNTTRIISFYTGFTHTHTSGVTNQLNSINSKTHNVFILLIHTFLIYFGNATDIGNANTLYRCFIYIALTVA